MMRTVPIPLMLGRRRQLGAAAAVTFNPATAALSAGVGLATTGITDWMSSIQLSHNADTATTLIVNGLAQQLANLDNAYLHESNPSCADQRAALDAYDNAWLWLQSPQACGNPNYGRAGNACISDRAPGGKYPWATYYRDPIANDPRLLNSCDTSQAVILPTVQSGYQQTGITAGGNVDVTAVPTPAPAASSTNPASGSPAGSTTGFNTNTLLLLAAVFAGVALIR